MSEEERRNNFEDGFRKEMDRQEAYNAWTKQEKSKEDTRRLLGQGGNSSNSENVFDKYSETLGLVLGGLLIFLSTQFPQLGTLGGFLGLLIIIVGFFPRLLMLGLFALAGYIFLKESIRTGIFDWQAIRLQYWAIIAMLIIAGLYIDRKSS
jgi:hypothetical protein